MAAIAAANLFPLIEGEGFAALVADIRENGLAEEIRLLDGKILDGRNRWRACQEAGVKPRFRDLPKTTDPIRYVVSLNLKRRHLSESQRAMIAAEISNMTRGDNKEKRIGTFADSNQAPVSIPEAAELTNVSERSVGSAEVLRDGAPEIIEMVKRDELAVKPAAAISNLPKEEQQEIAQKGPRAAQEKAGAAPARYGPGPSAAGGCDVQRRTLPSTSRRQASLAASFM